MSARHDRVLTAAAALVLAVAVAACGDDDTATGPDPTTTTSASSSTTALADVPAPQPAAGAIELSAEPPRRVEAGPITWSLSYTNVTDAPVTVTFPSAQPGDAVIRTDGGEVVHRWSDGRFFTQAVQEQTLAPGETRTVELADDLSAVEPGFYVLVLELAVVDPPAAFEQNVRVTRP